MERCSKCTLSGQSRSQRSTNCVAYFCEKKTWNSSPKCKQWLPQYSGIIVTIGNVYFLALSTVNIYLIKTFLFLFLVIFVQFPSYKVKAMKISSVQFSSVSQLCPTLCDPMDCSMPGFPVHHQCPELRTPQMLGIIINTYVTSQGLKQTLEQQKLETEALSSRRGRK